ncbi:MAG: acyl-ACP--UDP-N-acetylglucosamine O-acyltransferase [Omnitrophica bacterium]|nr:acyl-ACP--UDP-N-acetylglucosamine O-acyltransferase [Candidatus Omnitrophota bacterium]
MAIHPTAIVGKRAKLSKDVEIGPYVIIEDDVEIGQRVKVSSHAHILEHTSIGNDCQIHMGVILGHLPQIRQASSTEGRLIVGKRNIFREYTTVHRSSQKGKATLIGNDNYFMGFSHIAHDCTIGNYVTICNGTLVAGHASIEDHAFVSGNVTIHQFCRIGKFAMIGGLARIAKDVPPYMIAKGDSSVWAINSLGLKRGSISLQARSEIKRAFKLLYKSGLNVKQALQQLKNEAGSSEVEYLINFILRSQRGICAQKRTSWLQKIRLNSPITRIIRMPAYRLFLHSRKGYYLF